MVSKVEGADGSAEEPRTTRWFYDAVGRKTDELNAEGYLTEWVHDRAVRNTQIIAYPDATDPAQRASGALSSLRPTANPASDCTTRMAYDGRGNVVGVVDAEGYLTESVVDEKGHVWETRAYAIRLFGLTAGMSLIIRRAMASTEVHVGHSSHQI